MRNLIIALTIIAASTSLHARENFVQKEGAYKEILERVSKREERSMAIVGVRSSNKLHSADYNFRIRPVDELKVKLQLYWASMEGDNGEEYTLPLDEDIKAEITRQEHLDELLKKDEKARQAANAKKIKALTNGELSFGMSHAEIEKKRGKHYRFDTWQQAGSGEMIYSDLRLIVRLGHLDDAMPTGALKEDEKKIPFEDEVKK
jgi:hypothetical protein